MQLKKAEKRKLYAKIVVFPCKKAIWVLSFMAAVSDFKESTFVV